jgi:Uma2 family endonuclease
MSTITPARSTPSMPPEPPASLSGTPNTSEIIPSRDLLSRLYRLSVRQFDQMVDKGVLAEDDRVELIEGLLVTKMGKKRPHVQAGVRGLRLLSRVVPGTWHVRKEDPIVTSEWGKPEPDLSVVRGRVEDYDDRDVAAADVALVVEIAESSLSIDRSDISLVYSSSGIPVYWIVNLVDHQVEVYSDPGPAGYQSSPFMKPGQDIPVVIDGSELGRIAATDLLPPGP